VTSLHRSIPILATLVAFGCAAPSGSTTNSPAPASARASTQAAITPEDLRQRIFIYANDSMQGRETGSPGNLKAIQYIERELRRLQLQPAGDSGGFFQAVPLERRDYPRDRKLQAGAVGLAIGTEYYPVQVSPTLQPLNAVQAIWAGEDGAGLTADQVRGKLVVLKSPLGARSLSNPALLQATAISVAQWESIDETSRNQLSTQPAFGPPPTGPQRAVPTVIFTTAAAERAFFGGRESSTLTIGDVGVAISGDLQPVKQRVTAYNVVAVLPGSDPALRGSYVAVGAHNDHLGMNPVAYDHDSVRTWHQLYWEAREKGAKPSSPELAATIRVNMDSLRRLGPVRRDSVFNGADDDGSGSMALLEIAEAMVAGVRPKRSTLFVWHAGEERGLLGSLHFTQNPTVPRDSIIAQVNIDMIGRGTPADQAKGGPTYLGIVGSRRLSTEYGAFVETVNSRQPTPFALDYTLDADGHPDNIYCRSDHYSYARYGIPVAFFFTGEHGDYHQVTDEPQYLDYPHYASITRFVQDLVVSVANRSTRLVVDKPVPPLGSPCRQ
jgi:hypothetical protein